MNRFFITGDSVHKGVATIEGDDVQHISKVLRLREGEAISLCNQQGTDYIAKIDSISKNSVKALILEEYPSKGEPSISVVLYQGIPKSTKMDLIIQKCTEMGIIRIVPVSTARTVVKLETEKDEQKKVERWSKIAEEAAKQSKRGIIPAIEMPMTFKEALEDSAKLGLRLVPYELEGSKTIRDELIGQRPSSIGFFVGPEGGFEGSEIEAAISKGIKPITLGNRILRTETAGFATLTCIMYEYGQLG